MTSGGASAAAWAEIHYSHLERPVYAFGAFAFVPTEPARYMKTDVCAAYVPCERCGTVEGEPCRAMKKLSRYQRADLERRIEAGDVTIDTARLSRAGDRWTAGTHYGRREDYIEARRLAAAEELEKLNR